jgi:lysophospholipase L1-like esterase
MKDREQIESEMAPSRDFMRRLSSGRKIAFVAATLLGLVFVWALGLELAIRIFDIGPEINPVWRGNYQLSENPALRYELAPGSPDGRSKINSHGMRDREYALKKPPGTYRIVVIGDSIAYGLSVEERWSFSTQLEGLLENYFRDEGEPVVEVLNLGVTGYSFTQVLETLRSRALDFDPDLVIYAYSLNDPQEYSLEMDNLLAQLTEAEEHYLVLDGPESFAQRSRLYRLARYLIGKNSAARRAQPVWHQDDPQFLALREGRVAEYLDELNTAPDTWQPIAAGLRELEALSLAHGVPVHTIIFPLLSKLDPYPIPDVHVHLRQAFAENSIPTLDLLDIYTCYAKTHRQRIAADALHPNEVGHSLASIALLRHLLSTGSLPGFPAAGFSRLLNGASDTAEYAAVALEVERMQNGQDSTCAAL